MSQHGCRASRGKQDVKSENSAPISLEKICPECNKSVHFYDRTHYLVCKEEDSLAVQESFKRLLREHAARPPENKRNRWAKGGLRARYIANLRRKVRDLNKQPDFQNQKAVLEKLEDGQYYWILYVNGERIGPVEKATEEELSCWDPNQADGIDHSREVKG